MEKQILPITLVIDNFRSMYNVGSLFRTAEAVGVEKMFLCGITPFPPRQKITKVSRRMEQLVDWVYYSDTLAVVKNLKQRGFQIVALEQSSISKTYDSVAYKFPCALILGFEVLGISQPILDLADVIVDIPMLGQGNSLNVSVAFGIVAYEMLRQNKKI